MNIYTRLAVSALFATAALSAMAPQDVRVSVPFEFQAGEKTLPAGEYTVRIDESTRRLTIFSAEGQFHCRLPLVMRSGSEAPRPNTLYFDREGEAYTLSAVRPVDSDQAMVVAGKKKTDRSRGGAGAAVVGSKVN